MEDEIRKHVKQALEESYKQQIIENDEGKDKEIQDLRTKINLYKKCLNQIIYAIENQKRGSYDYGEAATEALDSIKDIIRVTKSNIYDLEGNKSEW